MCPRFTIPASEIDDIVIDFVYGTRRATGDGDAKATCTIHPDFRLLRQQSRAVASRSASRAVLRSRPPARSNNEGKRYEAGPSVEFRLPANFAVEFSALYSRTGATALFYYAPVELFTQTTTYRTRGNNWQFPLLGKYYFGSKERSWRPYLGTGYSLRTTWFEVNGQTTSVDPTGQHPGSCPFP